MLYQEVNTCASDSYLGIVSKQALSALDFSHQLVALRKHPLNQLLEGMIFKQEARRRQTVTNGERK